MHVPNLDGGTPDCVWAAIAWQYTWNSSPTSFRSATPQDTRTLDRLRGLNPKGLVVVESLRADCSSVQALLRRDVGDGGSAQARASGWACGEDDEVPCAHVSPASTDSVWQPHTKKPCKKKYGAERLFLVFVPDATLIQISMRPVCPVVSEALLV